MSTAALLKLRSDVEQMSEDPFKDGDVIRWKRRYPESSHLYTYAALRAGGIWFVTGRSVGGISYEVLVKQYLSVDGVLKISIATEWVPVDQKPARKRAKMTAAKVQRHIADCRYSGMTYGEVPLDVADCGCP